MVKVVLFMSVLFMQLKSLKRKLWGFPKETVWQVGALNNGIFYMVKTGVFLIHARTERQTEATLFCVLDEGALLLSADPRTSLGAPEWVCIT